MSRYWLSLLLSFSIALSPFSALPTPAHAQQPSAPAEADESNYSKLINLLTTIESLINRAYYPNVPRPQGRLAGSPTQAELAEVHSQLSAVLKDMRTSLATRIATIADPELESIPTLEIETFYNVVQRFEGLKIILGQQVAPETWNDAYGLALPVDSISQLKFFEAIAFASKTDVEIDGRKSPVSLPMLAELDLAGGKTSIFFRVNPDFVKNSEYQYFLGQMNTKSALMFAAHFAAHRLYEAQNTIAYLGETAQQVPAAPEAWRSRFASFRVQRGLFQQALRNNLFTVQKPKLVDGVRNALIDLQKQDGNFGYGLDSKFWSSYAELSGKPLPAGLNLGLIKVNENMAFRAALNSVVRLWSLKELSSNLSSAILFAKKLSLRWLILAHAELGQTLPAQSQRSLELLLDAKAGEFTRQLVNHPQVAGLAHDVLNEKSEPIRQRLRANFHQSINTASQKMGGYETNETSIQYLADAQRIKINALDLSELNKAVLAGLEKQPNYLGAYLQYKQSLFSLLQAYRLPSTLTRGPELKLEDLYKVRGQITFNPTALADSVPQNYIRALEQDRAGRAKDISDLLELGRLMKFHIYETLPEENRLTPFGESYRGRVASPRNLKIEDGTFAALIGSEKRRYLDAMKKDIFTSAPILGGTTSQGPALWEMLAANSNLVVSRPAIEEQVTKAGIQVAENINSLEKQIQKVLQGNEQSLTTVDEEFRVLVTRASQLGVVLNSFTSFKGYYEEIRKELLLPGFWNERWQDFNSWSLQANLYLIGFFVVNMFSSRFAQVGRATDFIGKALAPIFGVNFSRLAPIIYGLLGVGIADAGYRALWSERQRVNILKRYFECAAAGPCVALHADVSRQIEIRDAARIELAGQIIVPVLLIGGFIVARKLIGKVINGLSTRASRQLEADLKALDIRAGSNLSENGLMEAKNAAIRAARSHADSRVAELGAAYAEQAYIRLQQLIWKEAKTAAATDARFASQFELLKITPAQSKNPQFLNQIGDDIQRRYNSGQLTAMEYIELKNAYFNVFSAYTPIWSKMAADPGMKAFYETVWKASTGSSSGEIAGNLQHFASRIAPQFNARMNEFYGTKDQSSALQNLIKDLEKNPDVTTGRIAELRRLLIEGAKK